MCVRMCVPEARNAMIVYHRNVIAPSQAIVSNSSAKLPYDVLRVFANPTKPAIHDNAYGVPNSKLMCVDTLLLFSIWSLGYVSWPFICFSLSWNVSAPQRANHILCGDCWLNKRPRKQHLDGETIVTKQIPGKARNETNSESVRRIEALK